MLTTFWGKVSVFHFVVYLSCFRYLRCLIREKNSSFPFSSMSSFAFVTFPLLYRPVSHTKLHFTIPASLGYLKARKRMRNAVRIKMLYPPIH